MYNIITHGFTFPFLILSLGGLIGFIGSLFYKVKKKEALQPYGLNLFQSYFFAYNF